MSFVQRARASTVSLLLTGLLAMPVTAYSVTVDFNEVGDFNPVGSFYDTDPFDIDVVFFGDGVVFEEGGASGLFENVPSATGALVLVNLFESTDTATTTLTYAPGFTSVSLWFAALAPGSYQIYSGVDGSGDLLQSLAFLVGPQSDCTGEILVCDWTQQFSSFSGLARSIVFSGANGQIVIDDIALNSTQVPTPGTAWLLLVGLTGLSALLRRRRTVA